MIKRKSFTMIEIVLVLVITGLVGVAGSMAIVQIMQNYAIQKEYAKLELDSASTIRQLSQYLQNSIWDSIATRNGTSENNYTAISEINSISGNTNDTSEITDTRELVFIEKNQDIINGRFVTSVDTNGQTVTYNSNIPYFSGFVDLANSYNNTIVTSFSVDELFYDLPTDIENIFTNSQNTDGDASLYFPFVNASGSIYDKFYNDTNNGRNKTALFAIQDRSRILIDSTYYSTMILNHTPSRIGDIAIIVNTTPVVIKKDSDDNLTITNRENPNNPIIIAQNISQFNIWSESAAGLIRVRICYENKTMDFMPDFCKEGVIMQ